MRLVTFETSGGECRVGALKENAIVDLTAADPTLPKSVRGMLAADALDRAKAALAAAKVVKGAKLRAVIPDPQKVICVGLNYRDHAAESGTPLPREPVIFSKFQTAIVGPDDEIKLPSVSNMVDYEAELVVVIGKAGKNISSPSAMDHVAGYTVGHDVSARDWQQQKDGKQWLLGKSFDTFAPIGPALVTKDEIPDPHALKIQFRLNGQTMQDSSTSQLVFRIEKLIEYISQVFTLTPGDVIFTGTPPGVGAARKPPVFLKPGDECEVEIEALGVLRNRCV